MRRVKLTPTILSILRPALWGGIATIRNEIERNISQLYITSNSKLYVVVREEGIEFVVVAVAGRNLKSSALEILDFARNKGFASIRFHTLNPEHLTKGISNLPFKLIEKRVRIFRKPEIVYRLELKDYGR